MTLWAIFLSSNEENENIFELKINFQQQSDCMS
jgi:hypothetical protein